MTISLKSSLFCLLLFISLIQINAQCDPDVAGSCCGLPVLQSTGTSLDNYLADVEDGLLIYTAYEEATNITEIYQSKNGVQTLVSTNDLLTNNSPTIHDGRIVWSGREVGKSEQLFQKQGGVISQITTSYVSASDPQIVNGILYFDGERSSSPTHYDLVKLEGATETVISPSNSRFIGDVKDRNGVIYFSYIDTDFNNHIAKHENGVTTVVVPDIPGLSSPVFFVGEKIVYKELSSANFRDELWVDDNGVKTNLTQDPMIDRIDVIENTSTGVIWKEQKAISPYTRKIWTYDGTTISEVMPPTGLSATYYFDQIGDISFYYNPTTKEVYKVEDGIKTLLSQNGHRRPSRMIMEGNSLYYSASNTDFEDQVYSISCGSTCAEDITLSEITESEYVANNSITATGTVQMDVSFSAGVEVNLLPTFIVNNAATLSVVMQSCGN